MRRVILVPLAAILFVAQPAALSAAGPSFDPLLQSHVAFLGPGGALSEAAPAEGSVLAPTTVPGLADVPAVWAFELPAAQTLVGDAVVTLQYRTKLPAVSLPPTVGLFNVSLLRGSDVLASAEAGPMVVQIGTGSVEVALPLDGAAFLAGDGLGVAVTYHSLNVQEAALVEYLMGPEGSRLAFQGRVPSLDALGHRHAAGDQHFLARDYRVRQGDQGAGVWALDLSVGTDFSAPVVLAVPAPATRVLLQAYLTPGLRSDERNASVGLDLPGGPTTLYGGEVLVRTISLAADSAAVIACTTCGPTPVTVARFSPVASSPSPSPPPSGGGNGGGRGPGGEPLQNTALADVDAASAAGEDQSFLLVLVVPAAIMLAAALVFVMRREEQPVPPAPPASHAPAAATARLTRPARSPPSAAPSAAAPSGRPAPGPGVSPAGTRAAIRRL